ncbi:MAG: hypothetical protein J6B23_06935 [Clostridia bacterium]|nr:hypothetical protein [Clostridia bacterium]
MEGSSYAKTSDEASTLLRCEGESLKLTANGEMNNNLTIVRKASPRRGSCHRKVTDEVK